MTVPSGDNTISLASITDLRQRGNFEFTARRCDTAIALYSNAIDLCRSLPENEAIKEEFILNLCNRSACYSQLEEWELGQQDANLAWTMSNLTSIKAAYRLAKCSLQRRDFETAKVTIQAALRLLEDEDMRMESTAASHGEPSASSDTATNVDAQRSAFQELWKQSLSSVLNHSSDKPETSIKFAKRPISIKEFQLEKDLGHGNFSEIYMVSHKVTKEQFALKKIEKKQAADLFKRQHPNVYNEIQMERRVLLERLASPGHPSIVRMYHAFQDYNSLYYLMDLHVERKDLWSQLRYKNLPGYGDTLASEGEKLVMMGCHRSTACLWLYELIGALEYMHSRGIVHRDLKAENILLSATGHVIVIDFGTAKDLVLTDLNGPEFVGTPDFMSPEAVTGTEEPGKSSIGQYSLVSDTDGKKIVQAGPEADLWALGAIAFILQTGHTPYWSPSPYLAFLKIKRSLLYQNLLRPPGVIDDDTWDLIVQLMRGDPTQRIGAGAFSVDEMRVLHRKPGGYDVIRQHPYFSSIHAELHENNVVKSKSVPIPSLLDLSFRACAEMVVRVSKDYELCDQHPPGDGSKYDVLRLERRERNAVMHCLDRRQLLSEPSVYSRFFADPVAARLDKIRVASRDFVGLTQMNDDQGKPPKAQMHDPYAKPIDTDPVKVVFLSNPLFSPCSVSVGEEARKAWIKLLKKCIVSINRTRPQLVVVSGMIDEPIRKVISKISETIPTVVHDGSTYFSFWKMGIQCIAISPSQADSESQFAWLKQHLEQVRLSKHPLFVFLASDPNDLPPFWLKKLAQSRSLCIFGVSKYAEMEKSLLSAVHTSSVVYKANEMVDDRSIRSTDSDEDDKDSFVTKVISTCANGLHRILVDEEPDKWSIEFEII
jgi:serine/threonine protein kinase